MTKKKLLQPVLGLRENLMLLINEGVPLANLSEKYFELFPEAEEFRVEIEEYIEGFKGEIIEAKTESFFEKGAFVPKRLADELKSRHIFKTTNGDETIHIYQDGVYAPVGETVIKENAELMLGEKTKSHYINETVFDVKVSTYDRLGKEEHIHIVNMRNGLFDLEEMVLKEHDPSLFLTTQIPVVYDPEADCPKIKKFLTEIIAEEDMVIIQELFGYCLWRDYPIQKAFMFVGDGANGKSALINLFKAFLGVDNISSVSLQEIGYNRFAMARLHGKLANLYPDLPDEGLKYTGRFKILTGGDPVEAERKFKEPFAFTNYAKLIYSANKVPETTDPSDAFFRRWVFINFPNKFEGERADKNIVKKITTKEELSGLFNWAVVGLKRLLEKGDFSSSKSTEEVRDLYERMSSPVAAFLKDRTVFVVDGWETKAEVYKEFINYCKEERLPTMANNIFARRLIEHARNIVASRKLIDGRQTTGWTGLKLVDKEKNGGENGILDGWL